MLPDAVRALGLAGSRAIQNIFKPVRLRDIVSGCSFKLDCMDALPQRILRTSMANRLGCSCQRQLICLRVWGHTMLQKNFNDVPRGHSSYFQPKLCQCVATYIAIATTCNFSIHVTDN